MICTAFNEYMHDLLMKRLSILWKCNLNTGEEVWSDYDNGIDPWLRLKQYCEQEKKYIVRAEVVAMGVPTGTILFENPEGLDGIYLTRGIAKDMTDEGSLTFQSMTACLVKPDLKGLDVKKYMFPHCDFRFEGSRLITEKNMSLLLFKPDSPIKDKLEIYG